MCVDLFNTTIFSPSVEVWLYWMGSHISACFSYATWRVAISRLGSETTLICKANRVAPATSCGFACATPAAASDAAAHKLNSKLLNKRLRTCGVAFALDLQIASLALRSTPGGGIYPRALLTCMNSTQEQSRRVLATAYCCSANNRISACQQITIQLLPPNHCAAKSTLTQLVHFSN